MSYHYDNLGTEGLYMGKVAALEEMYLIYQGFRNYLEDPESWGEYGSDDLVASYRSFCQREPVGGMFLESVLEELWQIGLEMGSSPISHFDKTSYPIKGSFQLQNEA